MGVMMQVYHTVYSAKNKIVQNKLYIHEALKNRDTRTAAILRSENDRLRKEIRQQFGVILDV